MSSQVVFIPQTLDRETVIKYYNNKEFIYFIFQNNLRKSKTSRETYDLVVYAYGKGKRVLNENIRLLQRSKNAKKLLVEEEINIAIFQVKKSDEFSKLVKRIPRNGYLQFIPVKYKGDTSKQEVNQSIDQEAIPEPKLKARSSAIRAVATAESNENYISYDLYAIDENFEKIMPAIPLSMNPSPPADMETSES
ncbi:MAG: hypothetical protein WKF89_09345 [Chitinophagaceae bacterium]